MPASLRACAAAFNLDVRTVSKTLMPCAWPPAPGINALPLGHPMVCGFSHLNRFGGSTRKNLNRSPHQFFKSH
jgi:hypothetical protein